MHEFEAPPSSPEVGLVVDGKYRLIALRGEGAMGSVWQAEHIKIGHTVAIKFLHKAVASMKDSRGRFEREAKVAARLGEASRHVAKVLDHGVLPTGMPFVVMELLEGEGLDAKIEREKVLPLSEASMIVSQLSRALEVAHAEGVVHRDLKPANIFLCRSDGEITVKLLDFGVAKATLDNVSFATTRAGALIGTPSYMAPEQISMGAAVDARTDLWALAVVTYRLTTGQMPFGRGTLAELALRIVSIDPAPPSTVLPELPVALDVWMRQALAKKQEDRFQSARAMAMSLADIARGSSPPRPLPPASERAATKREAPRVQMSDEPAAKTLVSQAPLTDATLLSADVPWSAPARTDALIPKRSAAPFLAVVLAGMLFGGVAVLLWARSAHNKQAVVPPRAPVTSELFPSKPQSSALPEGVAASNTAAAPLASLAPPVASNVTPHATASHARGAAPHSASHAPSPSVSPSADDWNTRNQM